jgi:hypothetical protein
MTPITGQKSDTHFKLTIILILTQALTSIFEYMNKAKFKYQEGSNCPGGIQELEDLCNYSITSRACKPMPPRDWVTDTRDRR